MTSPEPLPSPLPSTNRLRREDEFELLCLLAGATLSPERLERIAGWDFNTLDWNEFIRLAERHGVIPLAASNLIKHRSVESPPAYSGSRLPPEIERSLRSGYEANLRRGLWFSAELARIMQHLERRQVRALPYKGPVLAQSLYGDVGLRSFSDLDFLISPGDFERAKQALAEIGYRPTVELTASIERLWLRIGYERSFDGAGGKNLVELQWALLPHFYAVDLDQADLRIEDLLQRAGRTLVGGRETPCLSPEDSLLVLCLHAAKHLWTRLIWLCDIAETVELPMIDYALLFSRAQKLGITRIMAISFWLVKDVLHGELPAPVTAMTEADPQVAVLGEEFAQRLERGAAYDFESTEYFRLIMKVRERRADRWRYLWRLVWTPGAGDVAAVRLPETLFPLYRIVRIGRLIRKVAG
jgi:putative nucleotidyltransferase-like protein